MNLLRLAATTISDPATAWRALKARAIPRRELWLALVALVALSTLAAWARSMMVPAAPPPDADPVWTVLEMMRHQLEDRPLSFAAAQFGWTVVLIGMVTYVGRLFDGQARFDDILLAAVWMKAILLGVQALQVVLIPLSLAVATLLAMVETVLYFLLAVRLTQVAHGFRSPARVGLVMAVSFFIVILALSVRLVLFGPAPPELP